MKNILLATDLSARSDRALARAWQIAGEHAAVLTVLYVADENLPDGIHDATVSAAEAQIAAALDKLTDDACPAPAATIRIVPGNAFRDIVAMSQQLGSDLIVLGRHRNESCEAAFGGTTMSRVIRMGTVPVLVVTDPVNAPYRRVAVGIDFTDHSKHALRTVLALAPNAELRAVHAFDVPFEAFLPGDATRNEVAAGHIRDLDAFLASETARYGQPFACEPVLRQGEVDQVLRTEVDRFHPDLIAVGTHGRSALAGAILGSVARNLLDRPPCDVLAVRSPA